MPAKAGIQYAVTPALNKVGAEYWISAFADDDGGARCAVPRNEGRVVTK
jgi:hypothetical protein